MRHGNARLVTILILIGCADPEPVKRPPIQVENPPPAVSPPETSTEMPAEFAAKVISVTDADIVDVLTDNKETVRIRLNGIDCPEPGQPFGLSAREFVSQTVSGQVVRILTHGDDRSGLTIGDIYHDGTLINVALVQAGLAWHDVQSAPDHEHLARAEQQAREMNRGLWSSSHGAIPPWEWRKMSKEERDEYR